MPIPIRSAYARGVLDDRPIFWGRLGDPVASATVADSSGGGHPGTVNGGVTLGQAGAIGDGNTAALFDGATGYVSVPSVHGASGPFTLEGWAKLLGPGSVGATDYGTILGNSASCRLLMNTDGSVLAQMGGGNVGSATGLAPLGVWAHIVYTWDGTTQRLYVNGVQVATSVTAGAAFTGAFRIGQYDGTNYDFNGVLDEVAAYGYALTASQVLARYRGAPLMSGDKALMEARSGIARSAATRSDFYRPFPLIFIAGLNRTNNVFKKSLRITTPPNQQYSTASMRVFGFDPSTSQQVIVSSGAASNRVFGGSIVRAKQMSVRAAAKKIWELECGDWTRWLNRRRVTKQYAAGLSGNVVFADIVNSFSAGFTTTKVKAGAPTLTGVLAFRGTRVADALSQVTDATSGWHWYADPNQVVHYYDIETDQSPIPLQIGNYRYDNLEFSLDASQIRTRMYGVGGGAQTTAPVSAGASSSPVNECGWYSASGGKFLSGSNIVTYTGVSAGSGPGNVTGCSGIAYDIKQGDTCNVFIQIDDAAAQAALALLEGGASDGIYEGWVENDRWSLSTTTQQATVNLAAFKNQDVQGTYYSTDKLTGTGKQVTINLTSRGISTTVTLGQVQRYLVAQDKWGFDAEFAIVWGNLIDLLTGAVEVA